MVEKFSTLLPMHLPIQGERMRHLCTRLGIMIAALVVLAPPATATSPPDMTIANDIEQQHNGTPAITNVAITRSDQDFVIIGDILGANAKQHTIGSTKIGTSPPNAGDATAGPPDKIEASPGMRYVKNTTKQTIGTNFMRSTSATADLDLIYGEPTNGPEYNLLFR